MRYIIVLILVFWGLRAPAQKLHLVLVSDVEDRTFGRISLSDEEILLGLAKTVKYYLNYELNVVYLNRANFTSQAVRKSLDTLKTQPNDLIIWHYSGRGFYPRSSTSQYPSFGFREALQRSQRPLSLDDVATRISQKGVRLAWVMADLRNQFPAQKVIFETLTFVEDIRKLIVEKLFLEPCGVIKVVSSQPNQPTYTNILRSNSVFAIALKKSFDGILYGITLPNLRRVSVDSLFNLTQVLMSGELSGAIPANTTQTMRWELIPCQASLRAKLSPVRSFEGMATQEELTSLLDALVTTTSPDERKAIITSLRKLFEPTATIRLSTNALPRVVEYGLEGFLESLSKHNPQLVHYKFFFGDFQRSPDFRRFTSLNLNQIINNP